MARNILTETDKLPELAVALLCRVAFNANEKADIQLEEIRAAVAEYTGMNWEFTSATQMADDIRTVRTLARQMGIDPREHGDTADSIVFTGESTSIAAITLREAHDHYAALLTYGTGQSLHDLDAATVEYREALEAYAGIRIVRNQ